ncbi:MAG TPA: LysR substrate-binding domain-containing protein [Propionibacteriaceae bacterium]|nr:LysR substrate-binding domain-containing protein [Propionibacteriaceae bacterium]
MLPAPPPPPVPPAGCRCRWPSRGSRGRRSRRGRGGGVLLPVGHRLASAADVDRADLGEETWIRAQNGSAADLTEHVLSRHRLDPPRLLAGHGDEPVETQALVAAGRGISLTHDLTVLVNRDQLVVRPLAREPGVRHVSVAYAAGPLTLAAATVLDAVQEIGGQRRARNRRP